MRNMKGVRTCISHDEAESSKRGKGRERGGGETEETARWREKGEE